jgi:hypothetical protein
MPNPAAQASAALLIALLSTVARPAGADMSLPVGRSPIEARRTSQAPLIDGQIDDPVWARAVPYTEFVDFFPDEGALPADRTELRVLYDNENLYISFLCHDARPEEIVRKLGDRDAPPVSDTVEVSIDVTHDRRTAYLFGVNAGGVQYDRLHFADNQTTAEWDAVWDARVAARPDGWSAELVVPLRLFRFASSERASWGFLARRHLARTHEDMATTLLPRSSKGYVSLFGDLDGLANLRPRLNVELLPYLAARTVAHPQFSDPAMPSTRLTDPSMDLGLDLRASLSQLQLNATVNPDFGQVEADQIILNLTNQEAVFPEKRPFFFQGTEIFQPISAGAGVDGGQVLFYSRRVGLTTPILGAAKLTGEVGPRLTIGLLDAFVAGVKGEVADQANPDRRLRLHAARPLHLGPHSEAISPDAATENYFAGVLTYKLGAASTVGLRAASAVPFAGACPETVDAQGMPVPLPAACQVAGNNAGAVDWALRTADAEWAVQGQAEASQVVGGPRVRVLPDGVLLDRGGTGWGTYVQAGKLGGEPFRFDLNFSRISPTLDLNGAGFLPTQNQQDVVAEFHYIRPSGFGGLHAFDSAINGRQTYSTDGRGTNRNRNVTLAVNGTLPGFHKIGVDLGYEASYFDIREITGRGVGVPRLPLTYLSLGGESDPSRMFSVSGSFARDWTFRTAATAPRAGWTATVNLLLKPQSRMESNLNVTVNHEPLGPRWTSQILGDRIILGDLQSGYLSATFRQQLVLLPGLVFQAYAQLFTAYGRYASFFEVTRMPGDNAHIQFEDLRPTAATADGFYRAGLRVNLVARWEYRPGSTLFAVYNHASESLLSPDEPVPATLEPAGLRAGRTTDTFLIKWTYFWHL